MITLKKGEKNATVDYSSINNLWVDADGNKVPRSTRTKLFGTWLAKEPTPYEKLLETVIEKLSEIERYKFNLTAIKSSLDEKMKEQRREQLVNDLATMTQEQKADLMKLLQST